MILNTFKTRDVKTLTILWKSLCLPTLLHNSNVMGQLSVAGERLLESVLRKYTSFMAFEGSPEYHERLAKANILSIQRTREKTALLFIGREIRNNTIEQIGVTEEWKKKCKDQKQSREVICWLGCKTF